MSDPTGNPYLPASAPTCRGVPDIGMLSGNITGDGYFIYSDGVPASEGGTSLSSPLMLGQWARVQAAASKSYPVRGRPRLRRPGHLQAGRRRQDLHDEPVCGRPELRA